MSKWYEESGHGLFGFVNRFTTRESNNGSVWSVLRSPFTNKYDPPLADGVVPSPEIRRLEIAANNAFDTYREMYYEGGVSSTYLWDLDDGEDREPDSFFYLVTFRIHPP